VRVNPIAISRVGRLMTHEPKSSNGDQEPAMASRVNSSGAGNNHRSREENDLGVQSLDGWSRELTGMNEWETVVANMRQT
jgi:hypothetical protein